MWAEAQNVFQARIRAACAAVSAQTRDMHMIRQTPARLELPAGLQPGAADAKEGLDSFLRSLRGEVEERLSDLDNNPGRDDEMRLQESEWAISYFRHCQRSTGS